MGELNRSSREMRMTYDLEPIDAPRLAGFSLRAVTSLLESPLTRWALLPTLMRNAGVDRFRGIELQEAPSVRPPLPRVGTLAAGEERRELGTLTAAKPPQTPGHGFSTAADYVRAYLDGATTPTEVAERAAEEMRKLDDRDPAMNLMVVSDVDDLQRQALASAARYARGKPLGPLDGVPVAIKDELDQVPYPTRVGTSFLGRSPATEDAEVVARLRAGGALLLGKAAMTEIGIVVSGFNPHFGTPRNPYGPGPYTGGSSSGPAAVVGCGLSPISVGADGGGSIRTPASLCGVVGLKATYGRISEHGAAPLCWSVAHVGPFGATAADAALAYAMMAGPDPKDPNSTSQPAMTVEALDPDLSGVRLGVYRPWFEDATEPVVAACQERLDALQQCGAEVVEVELPDLDLARVAHLITISSEMLTSMEQHMDEHGRDFGLDVRTSLALARSLTSRDYVRAQRARTRVTAHFERALQQVHAIITPTTGCTAPAIRPDVLPSGESDLALLSALMRYVFPANLTGHPAISFPAGYDGQGLPVGMQAIGRPWDEWLLFRLAAAAEQSLERRPPVVRVRLLD